MKYCSQCGNQLNDDTKFCPYCGSPCVPMQPNNDQVNQSNNNPQPVNQYNQYNQINNQVNQEQDVTCLACLSFCFPIVGLVLYCVWNTTRPKNAKTVLNAAIVSFVLGILFYVILFIAGMYAGLEETGY